MEDAAARREARRRRILENSQSRLQKITGRIEEPIIEYNSNSEESYKSYQYNGNLSNFTNQHINSPVPENIYSDDVPNGDVPRINDLIERLLQQNQQEDQESLQIKKTNYTFIFTNKINVILLGFIVKCMYIFDLDSVFARMMFLPLFLFELTDFIFNYNNFLSQDLGLLRSVLLICGINIMKVNLLTTIVQTVKKLFQDFMFYFFTFVITHVCLQQLGFIDEIEYYERI